MKCELCKKETEKALILFYKTEKLPFCSTSCRQLFMQTKLVPSLPDLKKKKKKKNGRVR